MDVVRNGATLWVEIVLDRPSIFLPIFIRTDLPY